MTDSSQPVSRMLIVLRLFTRRRGSVFGVGALCLSGFVVLSLTLVVERSLFMDVYTGTIIIEDTAPQQKGIILPESILETDTEIQQLSAGAELFLGVGTTVLIKRPRSSRLLEIEIINVAEKSNGIRTEPIVRADRVLTLRRGTKIAISTKDAAQMPPMEIVGAATLGGFASQENPDYLYQGNYSFTERFLFSRRGSGSIETRSGSLRAASSVSITNQNGRPMSAQMLVEVNETATSEANSIPLLRVFATSGADTQLPVLQISRKSVLNKVRVMPRWTDRVVRNPLILGMTSILALILGLLELGLVLNRSFSRTNGE